MIDCFRFSPHQDNRPDDTDIKLLVIHNISLPPDNFSGPWIDDLFMGRLDCSAHPYFNQLSGVNVSAHLLITRTGEAIQYVPYHNRAWHAGVSNWKGESACNDFSIGIELEGTDDTPYSEQQYQKLASIINELFTQFPLLNENTICGHSDIAPSRKTDPGPAFDWKYLYSLLTK